MAAPIEIDVWQGDIAELEVDALVIGASESLFMTSGPAASLKRHGGPEIERAATDQAPIAPGSAIVTDGGHLAATYIIHAVGVGHDRLADPARLRAGIRAALAYVEPLQLHRLAFSLVGAETGVFPADVAAELLLDALAEPPASLESVVVATMNPLETRAVAEALSRRRLAAR